MYPLPGSLGHKLAHLDPRPQVTEDEVVELGILVPETEKALLADIVVINFAMWLSQIAETTTSP